MKFVGIPVIAVAKSVDDRFAEGFAVDLWDIHSGNRSGFESKIGGVCAGTSQNKRLHFMQCFVEFMTCSR